MGRAGKLFSDFPELFRKSPDENLLHALREALNQERVMCSEQFKDKIEATLNRRVRPGVTGRPRNEGVEEEAGEYFAYS